VFLNSADAAPTAFRNHGWTLIQHQMTLIFDLLSIRVDPWFKIRYCGTHRFPQTTN